MTSLQPLTLTDPIGPKIPIIDTTKPEREYWQSIPLALSNGYSADPETGYVFGLSGQRLGGKRAKNQDYPTVRFYVSGLSRPDYTVPIHKVIAYVIWGWRAFAENTEVRHLDSNTENNSRTDLALGGSSANQLDKPPEVRSSAARIARAAQPIESFNALLSEAKVISIRDVIKANLTPSGRVRRGVVKALAIKYGVSPSTICLAGKGKSWKR